MKTSTRFSAFLWASLFNLWAAAISANLYAQAIHITCDSDTTSQLASTTDVKTFVFTSAGNEYATIRMQVASGSILVARIELYAPDGQQIASAQAASFLDNFATIPPVKLSQPGEYLVKAKNAQAIFFNTGEFGLSLQLLRPSCALPLACAETHEGIFEKPAQTDAFWFVVQPGEHFIFRLQQIDLVEANVSFYTLDGDQITPVLTTVDADFRFDFDFSAFTQPDTVMVLIRDDENFFLGDFAFSLQRLRTSCAQALPCNADLSGGLLHTEMDAFYLPVQPGDRMMLRAKGGGRLKLEFFHRDGTPWLPTASYPDHIIEVKHLFATPDTLLIVALRKAGPTFYYTSYGLSVQLFRPDCAVPLSCNVPIGGSFSHVAQMETFRFDVNDSEKVLLRTGESGSFEGRLEVYSPNSFPNPFWVKEEGNIESQIRFEAELSIPGTWYAVLMQRDIVNPVNTSNYGISFHRLDDLDCGTPIAYNTNLTAQIEYRAIVDAYVFNGSAGDVLTTQSGNCIEDYGAALELYDSLGNKIAADYIPLFQGSIARLDTFHLPASGRYKLLAFENYGYETGQYGLSFQKVNPGQNAPNLPVGQPFSGNFAYPTDTHVYTVEANEGSSFTLKAQALSNDLAMYVQIFDPAGHPYALAYTQGTVFISKNNLPLSGKYTVLTWGYGDCPAGNYTLILTALVGVKDALPAVDFSLTAYPNPFSESVNVAFNLLEAGEVRVEILNGMGEVVAVVADEEMAAGRQVLQWNPTERIEGFYVLRVRAGGKERCRKLMLIGG